MFEKKGIKTEMSDLVLKELLAQIASKREGEEGEERVTSTSKGEHLS